MNLTENAAVVGVSRRKSGLSAFGFLVLVGVGWVYGSLPHNISISLPMYIMLGYGLLVPLMVVTGVQALKNGSVLWSILLSLAIPVGLISMSVSRGLPLNDGFLTVEAFGFGMLGHLIGMEIGRRRGAAAREASDREQYVIAGIVIVATLLTSF